MPVEISRDDIQAAARDWIGHPWRHQGRDGRGIDCVGLIIVVARALGITVEDMRNYRRVAQGRALHAEMDARLVRRPIARHVPGSVLLFRNEPFPRHTGIATIRKGVPCFVHARQTGVNTGIVMEEKIGEEWDPLLLAVYDYPGAEPWPS